MTALSVYGIGGTRPVDQIRSLCPAYIVEVTLKVPMTRQKLSLVLVPHLPVLLVSPRSKLRNQPCNPTSSRFHPLCPDGLPV